MKLDTISRILLLIISSISIISCNEADGLYDTNIQDIPADRGVVSWLDNYCGNSIKFCNTAGDTIYFSLVTKDISYVVGKSVSDINTYDHWDVRNPDNFVSRGNSVTSNSYTPHSFSDETSLIDLGLGIFSAFTEPREPTEYLIRKEFVKFTCKSPNSDFPTLHFTCPGTKSMIDMNWGEFNVSFDLIIVKDSVESKIDTFIAPYRFSALPLKYETNFDTLYYHSYGSMRSICLNSVNSSFDLKSVCFNFLGIGGFNKNGVFWFKGI